MNSNIRELKEVAHANEEDYKRRWVLRYNSTRRTQITLHFGFRLRAK